MDENQNLLPLVPDIPEPDKTKQVEDNKEKNISKSKLRSLILAAAAKKQKRTTEIIKPLDTVSQGPYYFLGSASTAFRKLNHEKCLRMNTNPALFVTKPINARDSYQSKSQLNYSSLQETTVLHIGPKPNKKFSKPIIFPLLIQNNSGNNGTTASQSFPQISPSNFNSTDQTSTSKYSTPGTALFGSVSRSENETTASISESESKTATLITESEDLDGIPSIAVIIEYIDRMHQKRLAKRGQEWQDPMYQTALADGVGRAGSKNRGYRLRDPGPYLMTRNASEIQIEHIKNLETVDADQLDKYITILRYLGIIIMITGIILLLFIFGTSFNVAVADYFRKSAQHLLTLVILLAGIFQPIAIGLHCLIALSQLNHLRAFFLRTPFTLVIPLMLLIYGAKFINSTHEALEAHLQSQIELYDMNGFSDVRRVWDGIQVTLTCCGINSSLDWKAHLNVTGQAAVPRSCCIDQADLGCPNFVPMSAFHSDGCLSQLQHFNFGVGIFICVMAGTHLLLETTAVVLIIRLYNLIKDEMDDSRTNCGIIMGKFHSICDAVEYDEEQELAEAGQLEFNDIVRPLPEYAVDYR